MKGSVTCAPLWCPNFMQKLEKINGQSLRCLRTDHGLRDHGRADKGDYISREFARLWADLQNDGKPINPTPFVLVVKKKYKNSKGGQQHDTFEFLTKLLNSVPKKMVRDKLIKSFWTCQTSRKEKSHTAPSYIYNWNALQPPFPIFL